MIEFLTTSDDGVLVSIDKPEKNCWVNIVAPDAEDRHFLRNELGVNSDFVASALDEEESAHLDYDDDTRQTLVIVDCPVKVETSISDDVFYETQPLSMIIMPDEDIFVTVSLSENDSVEWLSTTGRRRLVTGYRSNMVLQFLYDIARRYLTSLRRIERRFNENEHELRETLRNEELIKMLGLRKTLIYFSTSLKTDEAVLARIRSKHTIELYDDDQDLLDDVIIEFRQAIEMCSISSGILEGTMDAFGSIISNNTNNTMKALTIVMLVMSVPTIVFSFYGMNVEGLPLINSPWAPFIIAIVLVATAFAVFRLRKDL